MSFVVEIPSVFTKPTQIPVRLGNTILTGNETIQGSLSVNGSLILNSGVNHNTNVIYYDSLDISNNLNVGGDVSISGDLVIGDVSASNISAINISATSITAADVQPTLTAGTNITISGNTISASGGTPDLTAGSGIDITNNIISATSGGTATAMRVSFYNPNITVIGNNINLPYNSIKFINGISYNNSTYIATIITAGIYYISFSAYNTNNQQGVVDIRVNGTSQKIGRFGEKFPNTVIINGASTASLNVGDQVTIVLDNGRVRMLAVYTAKPELHSCNFNMFKVN